MTTSTTTDLANVPHPAGAEVGDWEDGERICYGARRLAAGSSVVAYPCITQRADGAFVSEDGDRPLICVDEMVNGVMREGFNLCGRAARNLAQALIDAADELDGWVQK